MLVYSPARIVNDARSLTRSANISLAEVMFVLSHTELTEVEKCLWLLLATHADSANLACTFSYAQLSFCVNQPHQIVHGALKRLIAMGFLGSDNLLETFTPLQLMAFCKFTVQLPGMSLLQLMIFAWVAAWVLCESFDPNSSYSEKLQISCICAFSGFYARDGHRLLWRVLKGWMT